MLQQTTVAAVIPYYERFLARFPDLLSLARASEADVLGRWAGLGYYARGRNLHRCAQAIVASGGRFPTEVAALEALPGIGRYTARAIAAIAFNTPAIPVDGNVERVVARLGAVEAPLPGARATLDRHATALGLDADAQRAPADFAQALFDLGATICTPRRPACALCPWRPFCAGYRTGLAPTLPRRMPRADRPVRHGVLFWLEDEAGRVLLRQRPARGLFAGMFELPGTAWRTASWTFADARQAADLPDASWRDAGAFTHGLTHLTLDLVVFAARVDRLADQAAADGFLRPRDALDAEPLPAVMRRAAALGRAALDGPFPTPAPTPIPDA